MSLIREALEDREVYALLTPTADMVIDLGTKALPTKEYQRLRSQFLGTNEWAGLKEVPTNMKSGICRLCISRDLDHMFDEDTNAWFGVCNLCGTVTWA